MNYAPPKGCELATAGLSIKIKQAQEAAAKAAEASKQPNDTNE